MAFLIVFKQSKRNLTTYCFRIRVYNCCKKCRLNESSHRETIAVQIRRSIKIWADFCDNIFLNSFKGFFKPRIDSFERGWVGTSLCLHDKTLLISQRGRRNVYGNYCLNCLTRFYIFALNAPNIIFSHTMH